MRSIALLGCLLLAACEPEAQTEAQAEAEAPTPEVAAMPAPATSYSLYGTPGPWWRESATRGDFDAAAAKCVKVGNAARDHVARNERAEAAYRGFLECMTAAGWIRGEPNPPPPI